MPIDIICVGWADWQGESSCLCIFYPRLLPAACYLEAWKRGRFHHLNAFVFGLWFSQQGDASLMIDSYSCWTGVICSASCCTREGRNLCWCISRCGRRFVICPGRQTSVPNIAYGALPKHRSCANKVKLSWTAEHSSKASKPT